MIKSSYTGSRDAAGVSGKGEPLMRKYRIGICCRDMQYAANLSLALGRESGGALEAVIFSSPETVSAYLVVQDLDLLLSEWPDKTAETLSVVNLTDRAEDTGIYMYQSVREITQEILYRVESRVVSSQPSGSIAVFSPIGRSGKTTLARALAAGDTGGGKLYIGYEDYSDRPVHSDLLYRVKQRIPGILEAAETEIVTEEDIRMLFMSGMYPDKVDVQSEDLKWFSDQLLQQGKYHTLVYDVGCGRIGDPEVLSAFDQIYIPVLEDEGSRRKLETFRTMLKESGQEQLRSRMKMVKVSEVLEGQSCLNTVR